MRFSREYPENGRTAVPAAGLCLRVIQPGGVPHARFAPWGAAAPGHPRTPIQVGLERPKPRYTLAMTSTAASATVVVSQRVRPGSEEQYRSWQDEITAAAARFEGFEGTEVLPPQSGVQDAWVVVFRFRTAEHLAVWMTSPIRRELKERGDGLFDEVDEQVVTTPAGVSRLVTVVVSRRVRPGREADYERWQQGITEEARRFPGFVDGELFRPSDGVQEEWVYVFRFASPEALERWIHSDERKSWLERAEPFVSRVRLHTVAAGLGGWFPVKEAPGMSPPPAWKQSMAVLLALYPTIMVLSRFLSPRIESWPLAVSTFLGAASSVALLSWVLMPLVNRGLEPWLSARSPRGTWLGTIAVVVLYGVMVAFFLRW